MEVNVLNLRKEIEDLKKVENLSSIITNKNPEIDHEVITFLRSGHVYYLNTEISRNSNWESGDVLFTIPMEYLPSQSLTCTVTDAAHNRDVDVAISRTTGDIIVRGDVSKSSWMRICAVWIK